MNQSFNNIIEVQEGLFSILKISKKLQSSLNTILKGREINVCVGNDFLIKVATNIGVANVKYFDTEYKKLLTLSKSNYKPDIIMDHTIVKLKKSFWKVIIDNFGGPVGTLPHYLVYRPNKGIDEVELLERISEMAESGVSFFTIHPTANEYLLEIANRDRVLPTTARGGGIILSDIKLNKRNENVFEKNYNKILQILQKHKMSISIGTTFRPSNVFEAMDEVHLKETYLQAEFVNKAKEYGVGVIMEGVGHIKLIDLKKYAMIIKKLKVPFMPLGPIPTDASISFDHVASAIGASYLGMLGVAKIIHSVTREEHTGGVPSISSVIEGLKAAKVAAHVVNISLFPNYKNMDKNVALTRAHEKTCAINLGLFKKTAQTVYKPGCNRCKNECPLSLNYEG